MLTFPPAVNFNLRSQAGFDFERSVFFSANGSLPVAPSVCNVQNKINDGEKTDDGVNLSLS